MTLEALKKILSDSFDVFGVMHKETYEKAMIEKEKPFPIIPYQTIVVVGITYPRRTLKHTKTHLVPSFYTFGQDYHEVLKTRIERCFEGLKVPYSYGVDNHPHDERLAAVLAGIGFFGKNQLIINDTFGSYLFLGMVFVDLKIDREFILEVIDDCKDCRICLDACPTKAISETGYEVSKCISHYNQTKRLLSDFEMDKNYALFGCDICQMVCPKNVKKGQKVHKEFELSGKEMVSIEDLFTLSEKQFKEKYAHMAYLWKGKTLLMRNALMLMNKSKNDLYYNLIESTLTKYSMPWYHETAKKVLKNLKGV
ncbi:MAG: DUF1730 domain-containing protein [Acholeplasma sp.]|nr:DUF1730 domain-containing protein [Acholeplasma sp.]